MAVVGTVTGSSSSLGLEPVVISSGPQVSTEPAPTVAPVDDTTAAAPAPVPPAPVVPFPTADDMLAVNDWLTSWQTQMEDIDYGVAQQDVDTRYQKSANDKQATQDRSAADEAMAARGIFRSSLRDAATYDIEATRALANTYLDNKMTAALTAAAARKNSLASAKTNFETGMAAKYGENAATVNDALNEGYATALANYKPPKAAGPTSGLGPTTTSKAPSAVPGGSGPQASGKVKDKNGRPKPNTSVKQGRLSKGRRVGRVVGKPQTGLGRGRKVGRVVGKPQTGLGS